VCFYDTDRNLLLSGAHVLPRITPSIIVHPQQRHNPLGDFYASLEKVWELDVEEVLPAHEYRFAGLADRVAAIAAHHTVRLAEIETLVRTGTEAPTAWELAVGLTWSRPWADIQPFMRRAAMLETLAHLVMLETQGRVSSAADGDGVSRWAVTVP
jgi:glyoxylase-like metal-dependent hydrolase (beta-lactamase superfamily II)